MPQLATRAIRSSLYSGNDGLYRIASLDVLRRDSVTVRCALFIKSPVFLVRRLATCCASSIALTPSSRLCAKHLGDRRRSEEPPTRSLVHGAGP